MRGEKEDAGGWEAVMVPAARGERIGNADEKKMSSGAYAINGKNQLPAH